MKLGAETPELDAIDLQILELLAGPGPDPAGQARRAGRTLVAVGDRSGQEARGQRHHHRLSRVGRCARARQGCHRVHRRFDRASEGGGGFRAHRRRCSTTCSNVITSPANTPLLLKIKTNNTASLERLIRTIRSIEGVSRTETMVVLSTHTERATISRRGDRRDRSGGQRSRHAASPRAVKTVRRRHQEGMTMHEHQQHTSRTRPLLARARA